MSAEIPEEAAQAGAFARRCEVCRAPAPTGTISGSSGGFERWGHRRCVNAWLDGDVAVLAEVRAKACADGFHEWPGAWSADSDDPTGDARVWECKRGCGHVERHPGYALRPGVCLTSCDPDCDSLCHEEHVPYWHRHPEPGCTGACAPTQPNDMTTRTEHHD